MKSLAITQAVILLLAALVLLLFYRLHGSPAASSQQAELDKQRDQLGRLSQELQLARQELEAERTARADAEARLAAVKPASMPHSHASPSFDGRPADEPQNTSERQQAMAINTAMAQVEKVLALSNDERTALRERLTQELPRSESNANPFLEVLGPQRFEELRKKRFEFRQKVREEYIEQELFTLSRKLSLSPGQEASLQSILRDSRSTFFPIVIDQEIEWRSETPSAAEAKAYFDKEFKRQEFVRQALKEVLTDEQMNKYLEVEATSSANIAHSAFVEASDQKDDKDPGKR